MWLFGRRHLKQRSNGLWEVGLEHVRDRKGLSRERTCREGKQRKNWRQAGEWRLAKAGSTAQPPRMWPLLRVGKSQGETGVGMGRGLCSNFSSSLQLLRVKGWGRGTSWDTEGDQAAAVQADISHSKCHSACNTVTTFI